jgi:hypothetical protein
MKEMPLKSGKGRVPEERKIEKPGKQGQPSERKKGFPEQKSIRPVPSMKEAPLKPEKGKAPVERKMERPPLERKAPEAPPKKEPENLKNRSYRERERRKFLKKRSRKKKKWRDLVIREHVWIDGVKDLFLISHRGKVK